MNDMINLSDSYINEVLNDKKFVESLKVEIESLMNETFFNYIFDNNFEEVVLKKLRIYKTRLPYELMQIKLNFKNDFIKSITKVYITLSNRLNERDIRKHNFLKSLGESI